MRAARRLLGVGLTVLIVAVGVVLVTSSSSGGQGGARAPVSGLSSTSDQLPADVETVLGHAQVTGPREVSVMDSGLAGVQVIVVRTSDRWFLATYRRSTRVTAMVEAPPGRIENGGLTVFSTESESGRTLGATLVPDGVTQVSLADVDGTVTTAPVRNNLVVAERPSRFTVEFTYDGEVRRPVGPRAR